jgi:sporulation protein YqfC
MSRNPKDPVYRAAEAMALPSEVLGASQIEITGCRQVLLCGHKGIRLYSPESIIVELADCAVEVTGQELGILTMTRQELLLQGTVDGVRFLR